MTGEFIDRLEAHIIPQIKIGKVNFQSMGPLSIIVFARIAQPLVGYESIAFLFNFRVILLSASAHAVFLL